MKTPAKQVVITNNCNNPKQRISKKEKFALLYAVEPVMSRICEKLGIGLSTGYLWLDSPAMRKKIATYKAKSAQISTVSQAEVLNEALRMASYDPIEVIKDLKYDDDNKDYTITYEDWKTMDRRIVKEIVPIVKDGIQLLRIKLYDKTPYIKMLLDHFKEVKPDQHLHVHMESKEHTSAVDASQEYQQLLDS